MKKFFLNLFFLAIALVCGAIVQMQIKTHRTTLPFNQLERGELEPPVPEKEYATLRGTIFGTTYQIQHSPFDGDTLKLHERLLAALRECDGTISSYRGDSTLSKFNSAPAPQRCNDPLIFRAVKLGLRIGRESDGALDITLPPLLKAWGLGPYVRQRHAPTQAEIDAARAKTGMQAITFEVEKSGAVTQSFVERQRDEVQLDVTALGEGLALDELAAVMEEFRVPNYYVEIGGEAKVKGVSSKGRPWRVGIERPEVDATELWGVVELTEGGISSSGNYRQFVTYDGQRFSHLIDPRTGWPSTHNLVSVSVIHASSAEADAWDTALMVLGPEKGWAKAVELKLAALFIWREADGLKSRATAEFEGKMVRK